MLSVQCFVADLLSKPFQVVNTLGWLTIPGTVIVSFFFFGFLVAGEEIESESPPSSSTFDPKYLIISDHLQILSVMTKTISYVSLF